VFVRVEALRVMDESERLYELLRGLLAQGGDAAALACGVIGERRIGALFYDVMMCLLDPSPAVRIAAVRAIGRIGDGEAATSLMDLLIGADLELRAAIEQALVEIGESGLPVLTRFIASPNDDIWRAVIGAVNAFGTDRQIEELLVPACVERLAALGHSHGIVRLLRASGAAEHWIELAERRSEELTGTLLDTIWRVLTRLGDERSIPELRRAVESRDEELRDHGLEILSEGIGNGKLSAALYAYYKQRYQADKQEGAASEGERDELLKGVTDPWLQAIAVKAGLVKGETDLIDNWEYLSTLDKIVFLKQVPLLKEVSVEQLGRVAGIARERTYEDGEYLMEQGKPGRALFIIVEGNVEVSGRSEDGTEGTIGVLGPLQTIGEAGLFDDRPSMVSAQAVLDKARVLEIQGEEAARLVRLYPDIGVALLRSLSGRLRQMEHMLLSLG
jgi:hypothetical protein